MDDVKHLPPPIRFGIFEVDSQSGELRRHGLKIKLQEQPFQALVMLLERAGEVVTREQLQRKLWPADTFVDFDRGLNRAINRLRDALGDDSNNPRFIETLPQRGYRFIVPVETQAASRSVRLSEGAHSGARLIESLAVLPLENLSNDSAQEYFADGMTDELITELAKITSLRVISRASIMQYKGTRKPLPLIARELGVDAVVEGTIVRSGQTVRITAKLVQACDDRHLWSEKYERALGDVLRLQAEVAQAIADQIQVKLTSKEYVSVAHVRPINPQAHEAYLKGGFSGISGQGRVWTKASNTSAKRLNSNPHMPGAMQASPSRTVRLESSEFVLRERFTPRRKRLPRRLWNWTRRSRKLTFHWRMSRRVMTGIGRARKRNTSALSI